VPEQSSLTMDIWTADGVFFKPENLLCTALHSAEILHSVVRGLRLTNKLTTWNKVLERVVVHHLDKKFPICCGNRRCSIVFTAARFWALSWDRWIQVTPSHPLSFISSLRLFFPVCLDLASSLFLHVSSPKLLTYFLIPLRTICLAHLPPLFDHPNRVWWGVRTTLLLIMRFSQNNYLRHHPLLEQLQFIFPLMQDTKFHAHIKQKAKL